MWKVGIARYKECLRVIVGGSTGAGRVKVAWGQVALACIGCTSFKPPQPPPVALWLCLLAEGGDALRLHV